MSVRREPLGTNVAWLASWIVTFCAPFFVGTPPALTRISLPAGVRAVSTATSRDQPPLAPTDDLHGRRAEDLDRLAQRRGRPHGLAARGRTS